MWSDLTDWRKIRNVMDTVFHAEGDEALEQVAQGGLWLPSPWMHSRPGRMWL